MGGQRKSGQALVQWVAQYLEEYYAATNSRLDTTPSGTQEVTWVPPQYPMYKASVDGAVFSDLKAVGVGVVIKDNRGSVIAALSKKIQAPLGAIEVEAKAIKVGL